MKMIEEMEALLQQVGLDWNMPDNNTAPKIDLSAVSDEQLIEECNRRGLLKN